MPDYNEISDDYKETEWCGACEGTGTYDYKVDSETTIKKDCECCGGTGVKL